MTRLDGNVVVVWNDYHLYDLFADHMAYNGDHPNLYGGNVIVYWNDYHLYDLLQTIWSTISFANPKLGSPYI